MITIDKKYHTNDSAIDNFLKQIIHWLWNVNNNKSKNAKKIQGFSERKVFHQGDAKNCKMHPDIDTNLKRCKQCP